MSKRTVFEFIYFSYFRFLAFSTFLLHLKNRTKNKQLVNNLHQNDRSKGGLRLCT